MPIRTLLDGATIQERYDGANHGDPIQPCRIFTLGESPNAQVRASQWNNDTGQFDEVDHLVDVVIHDEGGRTLTMTGTSDRLQNENGLPRDQATVEWVITAGRCDGCI